MIDVNVESNVAHSPGASVQPVTSGSVEQLQSLTNKLDLNAMVPEPHVDATQVYPSSLNHFPPLTRQIELPLEPSSSDSDAILLAVKLPSGKRIQRRFRKSDPLHVVRHFAESSAKLDFSATVMICDAPRRTFTDLNAKLSETELQNRTVLHLQLPDDWPTSPLFSFLFLSFSSSSYVNASSIIIQFILSGNIM